MAILSPFMLLLVLCSLLTVHSADYYRLLGVDRSADEKTIQKAFKKLSREKHPDTNPNKEEDPQIFMKISQAYEVLMNPAKREVYDRFGEEGITVGGMKYPVDEIYDCYAGYKNPNMYYRTHFLYEDSPVVEVKDNNLKSLYRRNEIWMLQFYGPRCDLSHHFAGEWNALAARLEGIAKVAAVNCDENEDLCKEYNVKKYPGIVFFPESTIVDHEQYTGERNFNAMYEFVLKKISGFLRFVNVNNLEEFLASDLEQVKVISFIEGKESSPLVKVLSREFKGKVVFGETRSTDTELIKKFNIPRFPSLMVITPSKFELYPGSFSRRDLVRWIDEKVEAHEVLILARELTRGLYNTGNCNINDFKFCLIYFDPTPEVRKVLDQLAGHFKSDPVSIFWVNSEKYPLIKESFTSGLVISRGKKMRHSVVECPDNSYRCMQEAVDDALAGSRNYVRTRPEPDFSDKKSEL
jgi:curved DNA-binding protein CbpA